MHEAPLDLSSVSLHGDSIKPPPPYLVYLLRLGPKYVPYPDTRKFAIHQIKDLNKQMDELRRVLVWTSFHVCCAEPESNNNTRPPFVSFPYARVFASKGTIPNSSVEEKLGGKMMIINRAVTKVTNQLKEALDFTTRKQRRLKGTSFSPSNLQEYLKEHIIVEGDKDGTMNIVSVKSYVREAEGQMLELFNRSRVYHRLGGTDMYDHWLSQTSGWKSKVESFLLPYLPPSLCEFFGVFFDACKVLRLPRFRLLAKTHKSRAIKLGRFPSRPIVGLSMACTTTCSVLTGIVGQILLKSDTKMHPLPPPCATPTTSWTGFASNSLSCKPMG